MNTKKGIKYILESCENDGIYVRLLSPMINGSSIGLCNLTPIKDLAYKYESFEQAERDAWYIFEHFNTRIEIIEDGE